MNTKSSFNPVRIGAALILIALVGFVIANLGKGSWTKPDNSTSNTPTQVSTDSAISNLDTWIGDNAQVKAEDDAVLAAIDSGNQGCDQTSNGFACYVEDNTGEKFYYSSTDGSQFHRMGHAAYSAAVGG